MPAYNFQKQFVPMILDRTKPHTIRRRRVRRPTVTGDTLYLNVGMRTKQCERIAISKCIKVEPLIIYPWDMEILKADDELVYSGMIGEDVLKLARADGFDSCSAFFDFFKRYKDSCLDDMELIHWDTGKFFMPVMGIGQHRTLHIVDDPFVDRKLSDEEKNGLFEWFHNFEVKQ